MRTSVTNKSPLSLFGPPDPSFPRQTRPKTPPGATLVPPSLFPRVPRAVPAPGVEDGLQQGAEEQHHAGAAEGSSALLLLLHRVARLHLGVGEAQRQPERAAALQPAGARGSVGIREFRRESGTPRDGHSRLDGLALQQSLVEQPVQLRLVLSRARNALGQIPEPQAATRVREGWVGDLGTRGTVGTVRG